MNEPLENSLRPYRCCWKSVGEISLQLAQVVFLLVLQEAAESSIAHTD